MRVAMSVLLATVFAGCASSGPGSTGADNTDATVEMTVVNRADGTVTAFAQWRNGPRSRLGVVRVGDTQTFTTAHRGQEVALTIEAAVPAPATGLPGAYAPSYVVVDAGESMVWEIIQISPPNIFYRRAQPD